MAHELSLVYVTVGMINNLTAELAMIKYADWSKLTNKVLESPLRQFVPVIPSQIVGLHIKVLTRSFNWLN